MGPAVATAGLSELFLAALNEIGKAGTKPVIHWGDLDGRVLPGGGLITATIEPNVVCSGQVGFCLLTDKDRSHRKGVGFERLDEGSGKFVNDTFITNKNKDLIQWRGNVYWGQSSTFSAAAMPTGVLEFTSQESEVEDRGRYVLANLADRLAEGTMVTFYWTER